MKKTVLLFLSLAFLFAITSCSNLLATKNNDSSSQQTEPQDLVTLKFSTKGMPTAKSSSNNSRSAIPSTLNDLFYEVIATAIEDSNIQITKTFELNETIELQVVLLYTYNITLNANHTNESNQTYTIYTGEYKNINPLEVKEKIIIKMAPKTEFTADEKGSLDLQIKVAEGDFSSYNINVNFFNKADNVAPSTFYTGTTNIENIARQPLTSGEWKIQKNNISPGVYGMRISFFSSSDNTSLFYVHESTFTIYAGMQTNTWVNEPQFLNTDGDFKLTKVLENKLVTSSFYVKGENSTNYPEIAEANDDNKGTPYLPLATLNAAIAKCTENRKDYTIYVDGDITLNSPAIITSNKSITIKAYNNTNKPTIKATTTFNSSCFTLESNAQLYFTNIILNGEGGTFNTNGGCINNAGILTLANCEVKNFSSNGASGGAIYSDKGAINATNCIFANNTVTHNEFGNGGAVYIRADGKEEQTIHNFVNCKFTENQAITTNTSGEDGFHGAGGAIHVGEKNTVIISGENTLFQNNSATKFGGAICVVDDTPIITINDAKIESCSSGEYGGAIYQRDESTISLTNVIIEDCTTTKLGGGIHITGIVSLQDSTINKCKTTDTTSGFGGGIYVKSGELRTDELTISECSARSGGGLYSTGENVILRGGRITNCSATSCGGGIYSNKSFNIEEMNITNCSITNEALSNGGAGIYISKSSSSNITANINNIQISNCSIPTNYVKGNAIFIKEGYSSGVLTVNIEDSIIGIDKSESFTKGTKPTTADVPYNLSVSDGANNGGINVINIEGNSESNNTVVNFKNTKISYNQCKEQTVYLNYAKATFDENTELLANYVEDYCGEIYIYQKGIVDFEGKIHHNFSSYALINNYAATAIRLYGSNTVLNIKNGSEIYDNDLGHTPSDTYYVSAIYNHQGTINFEGGTMQNNYNNSIHCYEIYNNGTLNISGNAKVGDPTETSKYNSIYLAEHAGIQSTITINSDITSAFVGRIYLSDYQYVLDTQVLDGSKVSDNNHKFEMVNINYSIKTDGKLEEKTSTSSASTMYTAISDADIHDVTLNLVTNQTIDIPDSIPLNGGVMPEYALTIPPGKTLTIKGTSDTPATLTIPYSGDALIVEGDLILENVIITANVHWSAITIKDNGKLFLNDGVVIKDINFGGSPFGAIYLSGNNSYLEMNEGALIQNARSNSTGAVELANSTAIFVMNGGTIENCILGSSHNSLGGGVCINNGTFTMNGGTIHNNSTSTSNADSYGGGVYIEAGTFTMTGGNITGNTTYLDHGDDLYVKSGATFTMTGGTIGTAVISNSATYNQTGGTITNESRE